MISIKRPSAFYNSSFKKLDSKRDSETLVTGQRTTRFITEKTKIRILQSYEGQISPFIQRRALAVV
jgi:hypothetical protein